MHDFHTHFIPREVINWVEDNDKTVNAKWIKKEENKEPFLFINEKWGFELKEAFTNKNLFLQEKTKAKVSHSVISPIPQLFMYDFPEEVTVEVSSIYNASLAKWVRSDCDNLSALGTVPLNHPAQAAYTLQEAMRQGLKGAIIGPGLPSKMLSDDFFTPFFEEANRLEAIIFIHPLLSEDPRLKKRKMPNLIGVPWETTVCATDLLLSGFLDKYPKIKVLLAHGGGYLPYQIGRLNKGYDQWSEVSSSLQAPPIEYLKRFWFDSVLWNQDSIDFLTSMAGLERVLPGSDYPFDLCAWPPQITNNRGAKLILDQK